MDGDNVSIFAYGATGSGKTFTMQGPTWSLENHGQNFRGLLPRTAEHIFDEITRTSKIEFNTKILFSAYEIYNDNIYDLLDKSKTHLDVLHGKNFVQVKNLMWNNIKSKDDINNLIRIASQSRRVESTQFNESSSRSHAIFQIKLEMIDNSKKTTTESYINIVDLAGSEKCTLNYSNKNKEEIENMKKLQNEANFINKSLSTLGRVISMLADKKSNKLSIPYRESKLTTVLQVIFY